MSFKDSLNKHYAHTQNSVKKYEVGGKVVTKKGATNDAKKGGYFDGRPHSQGGIKAVNIDNDQPIEVEGGEVVITKRAVADDTKKEFQGKMMTNKEILSKINESGGGVSFETGGQITEFAQGGQFKDDEYYISDDDLNFDIDAKVFADGGLTSDFDQIEKIKIRIINIQNPEKVDQKGVQKKYRGTYEKIFDIVVGSKDVDENFESFKNPQGKDINNFDITITEPVFTGLSDEFAVAYLKNIKGVSDVEVTYKVQPMQDYEVILDELQTRVLKLIDNVTVSDGIVPWAALESVFGDQLTTDRVLQILLADGLIDNYAGRLGEYVITSMGKDYLAAQPTQTDANQDDYQVEEIKIVISNIKDAEKTDNKGVMKMYRGSYKKLWDYIPRFGESTEQFQSFGFKSPKGGDLNNLYITIKDPIFNGRYEEAYAALQKLKGVTVTSVKFKTPPTETDRTKVILPENQQRILEIMINEGKSAIPYDKLRDKYIQKFPKSRGADDVLEAIRELLSSYLIIDSAKGYKIGTLGYDKIDEIRQLNQQLTEESNSIFEEFPYFAPDAVKEYNPQVLTVQPRSIDAVQSAKDLVNKTNEKSKIIELTAQLLQDIPVENVTERVEMSLLLDAEQKELDLLANPSLKYSHPIFKRAYNQNALETLIERARLEQNNIELPRDARNNFDVLTKFRKFLEYCVQNPTSYITNWTINFFGNWIFYAEYSNYDYALLGSNKNLPVAMSRVGYVQGIPKYMYVPQIVFQGLSKVYDRVGFEVFPISYYATNYEYADWFATTKGQKLGTQGVILPCILNIRRPLDLSFFGIEKVSPTKFFDAVYLQTGLTPEELKVSPAFLSENTPDLEVWIYIRSNVEMLKTLKDTKICDGIHMYENNPAVDVNDRAYMTEVWITFYPEQTKVLPLYQFTDFQQGGNEMDRGWFSKSQFLKSGGVL
jgi:hypothetical protein